MTSTASSGRDRVRDALAPCLDVNETLADLRPRGGGVEDLAAALA